MPEVKKPRRGSLAFYPRKRARRIYPRISHPKVDQLRILEFAGYKAGMGHVVLIDTNKSSPTYGQEITVPVTILDCPPIRVLAIRFYRQGKTGLETLTEIWSENLPKDLERKVKVVVSKDSNKWEEIEKKVDEIKDVRLIVCTQPRISGIGKKTPEIFEIGIGGKDVKEKIEFAKKVLGRDLNISDVFQEGELVDVITVTKGKGTAGPVARFGVKIQPRKAKEKRRHVGSLGQERPGKVRWTVPMAGQLGFQTRTELNKRILKIGTDGEEITPKGGFIRYGVIRGPYALIEGSVPGPKKRLVVLRVAARPKKTFPVQIKEVVV